MNCIGIVSLPEVEDAAHVNKTAEPLVHLPVLVIFWDRPEALKKTLDVLFQSKPSAILFYQNSLPFSEEGKRKNDYEISRRLINEFVSKIDWSCEIHYWFPSLYVEVWSSVFRAVKWAFSLFDYCAILEDDCAPSPSWFTFAEYLLKKFAGDKKVSYIYSEVNCELTKYCEKYDYLFSFTGSGHGWASWKYVIEQWDLNYSWFSNKMTRKLLKETFGKRDSSSVIKQAKRGLKNQIPVWEVYMCVYQAVNHSFNIIPTKNLLTNNGVKGTNSGDGQYLSPKFRKYYFKTTFNVSFPLKEPPLYFCDLSVDEKIREATSRNIFGKILEKIIRTFKRFTSKATKSNSAGE